MKRTIMVLAVAMSLIGAPILAQQASTPGSEAKADRVVAKGDSETNRQQQSSQQQQQQQSSDNAGSAATNMEILRQKLRADKKLLVADNMELNDDEARGFWPVYDAYQSELQRLNERIKSFVDAYVRAQALEPVSDEAARKLVSDYLSIEARELELKHSYVPKLERVLPGYKVARYLQIENKVRAAVKYEQAVDILLVE